MSESEIQKRSAEDDPFEHTDDSDTEQQQSTYRGAGGASGMMGDGAAVGNASFNMRPHRAATVKLSSKRFGDGDEDNDGGVPSEASVAAADAVKQQMLLQHQKEAKEEASAEKARRGQVDDELWRSRRKHVFVLSSAGKPIFTRYGDESDFSELFGILQVLISMAQTSSIRGSAHDALRRVTCGPGFAMHFFIQEELYFVMVTRTEESPRSCVRQLKMLYHQLQSVLPTINTVLKKNPGYDIRRIFSDRDAAVMRQLIKRQSTEPAYLFRAQQAAAMPQDARKELSKILLRTYSGNEDHLFSFITFKSKILANVSLEKQDKLHIEDLLLLLNFVASLCNSQAGEIWAPFCMPRFNDSGYLWCYVMSLSEGSRLEKGLEVDTSPTSLYARSEGILLIQLATSQEAFPTLSETSHEVCRALGLTRIESLEKSVERDSEFPIQAVATQQLAASFDAAVTGQNGQGSSAGGNVSPAPASGLPLSSCGGGGVIEPLLWVAVVTESQQLIMSQWPTILKFSKTERKQFLRLIVRLKDKLSQISTASVPMIIHNVDAYNVLVQKQQGVGDVYAMFLPCTTKKFVAAAGALIARAVKAKEGTFSIARSVQWPVQ